MEKLLLMLLKEAMETGKPSEETCGLLQGAQLHDLLKLAEQHNILTLVGPLVLEAVPEMEDGSGLRSHIKKQVIRQIMASSALVQVTEAMEKENIPYLLVKGAFCRSLYPNPAYRSSTDEDILVPKSHFLQAERLLLTMGYQRGTEAEESHVHSFFSTMLHLELHRVLTEEPVLEALLEEHLKAPAWFSLEGRMLRTLPAQAHFLYLTAHFYKHFLTGGVGIRQVADMVMVARQGNIRWEQVWEVLHTLGTDILICGVLEIGETYLGLDHIPVPEQVRASCPGCELLLEDILDAGVFGASTMERKHSSLMTLEAVEGREKSSVLRTAFPRRGQLVHGYPYLKTRPWLLPVAWGSRIFGYLCEGGNPAKRAAESTAFGKKRVELLRQYGIIK